MPSSAANRSIYTMRTITHRRTPTHPHIQAHRQEQTKADYFPLSQKQGLVSCSSNRKTGLNNFLQLCSHTHCVCVFCMPMNVCVRVCIQRQSCVKECPSLYSFLHYFTFIIIILGILGTLKKTPQMQIDVSLLIFIKANDADIFLMCCLTVTLIQAENVSGNFYSLYFWSTFMK